MPTLHTLFFDAAYTLIHPHPSVGEIYAARAQSVGVTVDAGALNKGFVSAWTAVRARTSAPPYGATNVTARRFWRVIVERTFERSGAAMPPDPFFDQLFDEFGTAACWRLYDDAAEAIAMARAAGLRVGILSNFDSRLHTILKGLKLDSKADHLMVSCDAGVEKPFPGIFAAAARAAGVQEPARLGMIGDTLDDDYEGATRCGWRACLLDRAGKVTQPGVQTRRTLPEAVECLLT